MYTNIINISIVVPHDFDIYVFLVLFHQIHAPSNLREFLL